MRELPSEFQVPLWGPAMLPHGRRSIPFNHFVIKLYSLLQPRQKMINQHQTKHNGSVLFAKKTCLKPTLMMVKKREFLKVG